MRSRLAIILLLASCTDSSLERMTDAKAKACGCKTASCAEQVINQLGQTGSGSSTIQSTPKTQKLAHDIMECLAKLQDKERPSTDPDAEGSAAEGSDGEANSPSGPGGAAATPASPASAPSAPAAPKK